MAREHGKGVATNELTIIQPRQARSRATMERVLSVVEQLLAEKPFEQITVAEIAARSASAPTAIYARFSDKTAILLAVHERFREQAVDKIIEAINGPRSGELVPGKFLTYVARDLFALYRDNHRLLRSVLLADSPAMYARAAELGVALSAAIADRLSAHIAPDRIPDAERDLDFAVRTVMAVAQQKLLFGDNAPARFGYPDEELVGRMARVLIDATAPYLRDHAESERPSPL